MSRGRSPSTTAAAVVALLALVLAGCSNTPPANDAAPAPAGLERFYGQRPSWGPCAPLAQNRKDRQDLALPNLQCAYLEVPLDYAQPAGPTARLGVSRIPAGDPARRIGSLVINPGGPGSSGVTAAAQLASSVAPTEVGRRFDLVGFDPRGVGSSTPAIRCLTGPERDADRLDDDTDASPAGVARTEGEERQTVDRCAQRTGVNVLGSVGTREVAKDLDVLRAALGDEKLTYLGYSYGTRIGTTYAEQFPRNARAMILDGALDPEESPTDRLVNQGRGFQGAFDAFARACTAKPGCPLGQDPARATEAYQQLTRPLIASPLPLRDGRTMSYTDAQQGTINALYVEALWPYLQLGLSELKAPGPQTSQTLMRLADQYYERQPDGSYASSQDAFEAIGCVDDPRVTDPKVAQDVATRYQRAAPFLDSGRGAPGVRDSCAFWPVPPTSQPRVPNVEGLTPPLVISTTGDPATPYQAGVKLAQALKGSLLTKVGDQHTAAFQGFGCVDQAVVRYLIDGAGVPPGFTCPAT